MRLDELLNENDLPEYIDYNGQHKSTRNSLGNYIGNNIEAIQNFYNWFGNSKIVDNKNRPLVVYHGTNNDFDSFDTGKRGSQTDKGMRGAGFYFASDDSAKNYGNIIKTCYLSIQNPLYLSKYNSKEELAELLDISEDILGQNNRGIYVYQSYTYVFTSAIIDKGFDGVIFYNEYVAFKPNQIKSIKNEGTFNINKNNIFENINSILWYDNPKGDWLQYKIKYAEEAYNKGIKVSGPVTAYTVKPIDLPISFLKTLKGSNNEIRQKGEYQYDKLYPSIKEKGFDKNNPILIGINHRGEVYIIEGNTRVAVANNLNIDKIPCEVKYYAGGELKPGVLTPEKLQQFIN